MKPPSSRIDTFWLIAGLTVFVGGSVVAIEWLNAGESGWAWLPRTVACVGLGWFSGAWWALLLAPLPIALAVPWGYSEENIGIENELIYILEVYYSVANAVLITIGVGISRCGARKHDERRLKHL